MLAYDYPLLGIFWTMLWFFLFFIWIWILFLDLLRYLPQPRSQRVGEGGVVDLHHHPPLPRDTDLSDRSREGHAGSERGAGRPTATRVQRLRPECGRILGTADQLTKLADLKERGS